MIDGWNEFARKVIEKLVEYDERYGTKYAKFLKNPVDDPNILATIMRKVDRESQWEPIKKDI